MFEYFLNDLWIRDASDDLHLAAALLTLLYFYAERRPVKTRFNL